MFLQWYMIDNEIQFYNKIDININNNVYITHTHTQT